MKYTFAFLFITMVMTVRGQYEEDSRFGHRTEHRYGFIHIKDSINNIASVYDGAGDFSGRLVPVKKDGKWGFIDAANREVIAFQYDYARGFNQGQAIVQQHDFYGVINPKGEFVIPPRYYDLIPYEWEGERYYVSRDSLFFQGIIDTSGGEIIPHRYTYVIPFEGNLADRKLYRNIPFYTTYREIDSTKGSFYAQFKENAFEFSPEKGRQDLYDAQFKRVASRDVTSYLDGFSGEELTRIDAWLDDHHAMDANGKRTAIRRLLDAPDVDAPPVAGSTPGSLPASTEELNAHMGRMGYEKFSSDDGKIGVRKDGKTILPARFDIVRWWGTAFLPPPGAELDYLKTHFAGAYKDDDEGVFIVFGIAAGSREKGILYAMNGEEVLDLTHRIPEEATSEGLTFRTVKRDTVGNRAVSKFGFVNWKGEEVLPPDYTRIQVLDEHRILTKQEKETARGTEAHFGLYTPAGETIVPEGVFSAIEPISHAPSLFLVEWADAYPTHAEQQGRDGKNKNFILLNVSENTYSVVQHFTASMVYTRLLDPETGMLKYRKNVEK